MSDTNPFPNVAPPPPGAPAGLAIGTKLTAFCRSLAADHPEANASVFVNALSSIAANLAMEHGVTQSQYERHARAVYKQVHGSKYPAGGEA